MNFKRNTNHRNRKQRFRAGAAATEFAIIAPILFMTAMGMFELGRVLSVQQIMTNAAREGAREATLQGASEDSVNSIVTGYTSEIMNQEVSVAVSPSLSDVRAGDYVTVTVTANAVPMSGFGSAWLGSGFTLTAESTMRREGFD